MKPTKDDIIAVLEDRIAELEELLGIDVASTDPYLKLGLPAAARTILAFIVKREVVSRASLFQAVYGALTDADQPEDRKSAIAVRIWYLRNALDPHDIHIRTVLGVGGR